jgi:transposase-like protein
MTAKRKIGFRGKYPEHVREAVRQLYAIDQNKSHIARTLGINLSTVYRILKQEDPEVAREKRREALGRLASKAAGKAEDLIDNLEPPEEATYMQRATGFGILTDKVVALDKRLDDQHKDDKIEAGEMLQPPEDVEALAGLIRNDLREIGSMIGGAFTQALEKKVDPVAAAVEVEAVVTNLSDLDPGVADAQGESGRHRPDGEGPGQDDGAGRVED